MLPHSSSTFEQEEINISSGHSFHMIKVEGGTCMMGNPLEGDDDERPVHPVSLDAFWLGRNLVSQGLWREIMGENPAHCRGSSRPVEQVTWYKCIAFCNRLSKKMKLDPVYRIDTSQNDQNNTNSVDNLKWLVKLNSVAKGFRLPTEAEWEYAAKGGNSSLDQMYAGGNSIKKLAWYRENGFKNSHPVSLKAPNALGFFDMAGNLEEWCWDWFGDDYYQECKDLGKINNPLGPISGSYHVVRGGGWMESPFGCRVVYRGSGNPNYCNEFIGLRLARTAL